MSKILRSRLARLAREPMAMHEDVLADWLLGVCIDDDQEIAADAEAAAKPTRSSTGKIAVLPVYGVISKKGQSRWESSTDTMGALFDHFVSRPDVDVIILDIDSPGGTVSGTPELAQKIYRARGEKKVVAVANSMAASAAYWIGSAASEFVVTPSGSGGSIGVWNLHIDQSKMLEDMGLKVTIYSAGKHKVDGHPFGPPSEEASIESNRVIGVYYEMFVEAVAKHRGTTAAAVRGGFGEGKNLDAEAAKAAGLFDRVDEWETILGRLGASAPTMQNTRQRDSVEIERRRNNLTQIQ